MYKKCFWLIIIAIIFFTACKRKTEEDLSKGESIVLEEAPSLLVDTLGAEVEKRAVTGDKAMWSKGRCDVALKPVEDGYFCVDSSWYCGVAAGCLCGDSTCLAGDRCEAGACVCGAEKLRSQRGEFMCKDETWLCVAPNRNAHLHRYAIEWNAAPDQDGGGQGYNISKYAAASAFSCICGDSACGTGAVCKEGKCLCGDKLSPAPGDYACVEGQWRCDDISCVCADTLCGHGAVCVDGKCLCGNAEQPKSAKPESYYCDKAQWLCNDRACQCGQSKCMRGSVCLADGKCICGSKDASLLEQLDHLEEPYHCENGRLLCGARNYQEENTQICCGAGYGELFSLSCRCGDGFAPHGAECIDGKAHCGGKPKPGDNYYCFNDKWICELGSECPCGEKSCGGYCNNGECEAVDLEQEQEGVVCESEFCACGSQHCMKGEICFETSKSKEKFCQISYYAEHHGNEAGYIREVYSELFFCRCFGNDV